MCAFGAPEVTFFLLKFLPNIVSYEAIHSGPRQAIGAPRFNL